VRLTVEGINMTVEKNFSTVIKVLCAQILVAVLVTSGFYLAGGWKNALSPFLGSVVALLPNGYVAYRLYLSRNWDAKKILRSFYASESKKILLTAALFAIVLQVPNVDLLILLLAYAAVLSVFWFALILWRN
jgi:ATP synthase protein I